MSSACSLWQFCPPSSGGLNRDPENIESTRTRALKTPATLKKLNRRPHVRRGCVCVHVLSFSFTAPQDHPREKVDIVGCVTARCKGFSQHLPKCRPTTTRCRLVGRRYPRFADMVRTLKEQGTGRFRPAPCLNWLRRLDSNQRPDD